MQDDLAPVLEVHGDARADHGLDLAKPPIRLEPVAHQRAHLDETPRGILRHGRGIPHRA